MLVPGLQSMTPPMGETLRNGNQQAAGPRARSFSLPTPVSINAVETDNYRTKTLVLNAALDAQPGQFVMAWLPRFDEKPFTLVDADPVTLMITAVGPFTHLLHQKQPGDFLWIRGAFGIGYSEFASPTTAQFGTRNFDRKIMGTMTKFSVPKREEQQYALVGGGYGVASLLWLARRLLHSTNGEPPPALTAVIGARTAADLLYAERFAAINDDLTLLLCTEDGSSGIRGRVTDVLEPRLDAGELDGIYACGPHGMLDALNRLGEKYDLPRQLCWEAYVRCAMGICGSCEHHGKLLCLDGPVLSMAG